MLAVWHMHGSQKKRKHEKKTWPNLKNMCRGSVSCCWVPLLIGKCAGRVDSMGKTAPPTDFIWLPDLKNNGKMLMEETKFFLMGCEDSGKFKCKNPPPPLTFAFCSFWTAFSLKVMEKWSLPGWISYLWRNVTARTGVEHRLCLKQQPKSPRPAPVRD